MTGRPPYERGRAMSASLTCLAVMLTALVASALPAAAQTELVEYYATDALGSIRVVFDPNGTVTARTDYLPFGEEYQPTGNLPRQRFTGQERDAEEELDNFNARSYQVRVGRFTRVDPAVGNPANPQSWNRYSYVVNNPLGFTDPTGMQLNSQEGQPPGCRAEYSFEQCGGHDVFWGLTSSPFSFGNEYATALMQGWLPGMPDDIWVGLQFFNQSSEQAFREARERSVVASVATAENFHIVLDTLGLIPGLGELADGLNGLTYLLYDNDYTNAGLSAAAMWPAGGQAVTAARAAGRAGEAAAGITKNTAHIDSLTKTANYRIPDILDPLGKVIGEVKNVAYQAFTRQLRDFAAFAEKHGFTNYLVIPPSAKLSGPLKAEVESGKIVRVPLEKP